MKSDGSGKGILKSGLKTYGGAWPTPGDITIFAQLNNSTLSAPWFTCQGFSVHKVGYYAIFSGGPRPDWGFATFLGENVTMRAEEVLLIFNVHRTGPADIETTFSELTSFNAE